MCPPAPISNLAEIDDFWTDEGIVKSLLDFKNGSPLPLNVTSDVNPYQFKPSDLPEGLWYFCSGVKKEEECGFWLETGEACEIFRNSSILGSRTTLQFHEGQAPNAQKTDWVMQEYRITEKSNNNPKDSRALCRVFLVDERRPLKMDSNVNISEQSSKSQLLENTTKNDTGPSIMAKRSPDPFLENFPEMEHVLTGDYLELNDLIDPISRSSSSANSSCLTMTSEEYFDSMALLRELDDDIIDQNTKGSNVKFNISESVKSKEVVVCPATSGSLGNGGELKTSNEGTSKLGNGGELKTSNEGTSKEVRKERGGGTKKRKMMKYLCFMAF